MSLSDAPRELTELRRALERLWDGTETVWDDVRRREFEARFVAPLLRGTVEMVREMEAAALVVERALSGL